jgi:demethylmenaquinone methyltransferase / 2-methoxy-6-polyprenyl-1,4-benzoquinol methylase
MLDERTRHARALFDGIGPAYGWPADLLSFGQYGRWRRALVRSLGLSSTDEVLDVATGTGLIARDIQDEYRCRVIGADQSEGMLANARGVVPELTAADANRLPFADTRFDAVVFSYLLRYTADPPATLAELVRVLKPGGMFASVEFGVPRASLPRLGWRVHAQAVFPVATRAFGARWADVGAFLPGSIVDWIDEWPIERQARAWRDAGVEDVKVKQMFFGTGVLMKGRKRGG